MTREDDKDKPIMVLGPTMSFDVIGVNRTSMIEQAKLEAAVGLNLPLSDMQVISEGALRIHRYTRFVDPPTPELFAMHLTIGKMVDSREQK